MYEKILCLLVMSLTTKCNELRAALRRYVILQHVRLAEGGQTVPSGFSCELCKAEWPQDWLEHHHVGCLLGKGHR